MVMIIGFAVIVIVLSVVNKMFQDSLRESTINYFALDKLHPTTTKISSAIDNYLQTSVSLSRILASSKNKSIPPDLKRDQVNSIIQHFLANSNYITAIGIFWEPNEFDNKDQMYAGIPGYGEYGTYTTYFFLDAEENIRNVPYTECYMSDFYNLPKKNNKALILPPEVSNLTGSGELVLSFVSPILYHGKFYGVVKLDISTLFIEEYIREFSIEEGSFELSLVSEEGKIITNNYNNDHIGKNLQDLIEDFEDQILGIKNLEKKVVREKDRLHVRIPVIAGKSNITWQLRANLPETLVGEVVKQDNTVHILLPVLLLFILSAVGFFLISRLLRPLSHVIYNLNTLAVGKIDQIQHFRVFGIEFEHLKNGLERIKKQYQSISRAIREIAGGKLDSELKEFGREDMIGQALHDMQNNLKKNKVKEQRRKEEDANRNWMNKGIAIFNDILRQQYDEVSELGYQIIRAVLIYLKANQGGVFLMNDEDQNDIHLELIASVAYDERRFMQKKVYPGEGLLGSCAVEKKTIHLNQLPENYIEITSGLGGANPQNLLICPLVIKDDLYGIIELASFKEFRNHEIEFVERLSESIAATISMSKINERTRKLLELSQKQSKEMASQEEEMRQNIEELTATQEELERKQTEMEALLNTVDKALIESEIDANGTIIRANDNYLSTSGYSKDEIIGKDMRIEMFDEDIQQYNLTWNNLLKGIAFRGETRRIRKDGAEKWYLSTYVPALDIYGRVYKIYYLAEDITELKNLEKKSREQEKQIRELKKEKK